MSNEQTQKESESKQDVLKIIRDEARCRPIVPFLGAGISISAGFPTLKYVIQYLAKVDFAIQFGVFENRFPDIGNDQTALGIYRLHPSRYLEDFGWPNIGQLNADIWEWLGRNFCKETNQRLGQKTNREKGKEVHQKENEELLKRLANDVCESGNNLPPKKGINIPLEFRDHQQAIVQLVLRSELAARDKGTEQAMSNEWSRWKHNYVNNEDDTDSASQLLHGDWEMLLDKLCEGKHNLTDARFTSFEQRLTPALAHRYLAFLQPKLGMPLLLSTNFDSLLERAFHQEGIPLKVFDVHRDAALPDATLVCHQPSLLKLHGSAYGLRVGERLRYSLEMDARSNAMGYIPPQCAHVGYGI